MKKVITHLDMKLPQLFESIEDYGDYAIVRLQGIDDMTTIPETDKIIDQIKVELDLANKHIIVDYKNVSKVDSSVIAAILLRIDELAEHDRQIVLINIPDQLNDLLEIQKVHHHFKVFETQEEAIEHIYSKQ